LRFTLKQTGVTPRCSVNVGSDPMKSPAAGHPGPTPMGHPGPTPMGPGDPIAHAIHAGRGTSRTALEDPLSRMERGLSRLESKPAEPAFGSVHSEFAHQFPRAGSSSWPSKWSAKSTVAPGTVARRTEVRCATGLVDERRPRWVGGRPIDAQSDARTFLFNKYPTTHLQVAGQGD
jgi:hypothetical protein